VFAGVTLKQIEKFKKVLIFQCNYGTMHLSMDFNLLNTEGCIGLDARRKENVK
jgi:hypothetical protein